MSSLVVALLVALAPQDEGRLKESWPKLAEAWKAVEAYKPGPDSAPLDDEYLKLLAKVHGAFEAAGLFAPEGEYLPQALKAFIKIRVRNATAGGSALAFRAARIRIVMGAAPGGGAEPAAPEDPNPMGTLLGALKKLQALKDGGMDDEDNVQDEMVAARKALKALKITADDTPPALRRRALRLVRALALGEAFPEAAVPTEAQAKQFKGWIAELGSELIETRDKATEELRKAGEPALALLRESSKSADAEVASRARRLLGVGHAPWKVATPAEEGMTLQVEDLFIEPPAEEKPK
jgi:hypothetical protein